MNAHGRIVCLDAETGKETWAVNVLERFAGENIHWGLSESLLVVDDLVLATPCGAQGLVVALNKHSGDTVWTTPAVPDERPSYASPLLLRTGDRRLMVNSAAKHAFAVNVATGKLCWQLKQLDPSDTISTIPVLGENELVLTNASRGFGAMFGIRFDDTHAERVWTRQLSISHGSAVGVEGQVYAASSRGEAKGWVSVAAATGAVQVGAELDPGSLIYADGHIYGLTERGRMTLQKPTDDGFEMVGSFQFAQGKDVWAHPVICDGRLYLRFEDTLYCYDIRS
jgi:outer membrane protein assembly factor BamB